MDNLFISGLLCYAFVSVCFFGALWSPAWKGLTSCLSIVMSYCEVVTFLIGILGQVWCLIVSILDLFLLS